eukprot:1172124-Pyramimonas_sp.AAC.1
MVAHQQAHEQAIAALVGQAECEQQNLDVDANGIVLPTANAWLKQLWQDLEALDGDLGGAKFARRAGWQFFKICLKGKPGTRFPE